MIAHWVRGLPEKETAANIYQDLVTTSTFTSVSDKLIYGGRSLFFQWCVKNLTMQILADTFRRETLVWKLQLLDAAALFANAHLHLVQAQTLILSRF